MAYYKAFARILPDESFQEVRGRINADGTFDAHHSLNMTAALVAERYAEEFLYSDPGITDEVLEEGSVEVEVSLTDVDDPDSKLHLFQCTVGVEVELHCYATNVKPQVNVEGIDFDVEVGQ